MNNKRIIKSNIKVYLSWLVGLDLKRMRRQKQKRINKRK